VPYAPLKKYVYYKAYATHPQIIQLSRHDPFVLFVLLGWGKIKMAGMVSN
jgi:hypothetical protein